MIPKPNWVWEYTGSWPFSVFGITPSLMENSRNTQLAGFKFRGTGWYPAFKVLIEATGETRDGESTYVLAFYARDPRPALRETSELTTWEGRNENAE